MDKAQIQVASNGQMAQVRVAGRANHAASHGVREFALAQLERGAQSLIFDLSACESMDSTFMGILSMVALRARARQVPVAIVNASPHAEKLLQTLGIKKLFCLASVPTPTPDWQSLAQACPAVLRTQQEQQRTVLEAHEVLMAVNPDNVPRFQDVVAYLQQETRSKGG